MAPALSCTPRNTPSVSHRSPSVKPRTSRYQAMLRGRSFTVNEAEHSRRRSDSGRLRLGRVARRAAFLAARFTFFLVAMRRLLVSLKRSAAAAAPPDFAPSHFTGVSIDAVLTRATTAATPPGFIAGGPGRRRAGEQARRAGGHGRRPAHSGRRAAALPRQIGRASCREKCRSRWSPY